MKAAPGDGLLHDIEAPGGDQALGEGKDQAGGLDREVKDASGQRL